MATNRATHQAWAEGQIEALIEAGVDPVDAQATVNRILAALPEGADPATWLPPEPGALTQADVDDAAADWMANDAVPPKWKRILYAMPEEQGNG